MSTITSGRSSRITVSSSPIVIRKPPSPTNSTVVASGRPLAKPSAVPKPSPIEAKSLLNLKMTWIGYRQIRHDAQKIARVVYEVTFLRQQLIQFHCERARVDRARRVHCLEVARDIEG